MVLVEEVVGADSSVAAAATADMAWTALSLPNKRFCWIRVEGMLEAAVTVAETCLAFDFAA